MNNLQSVARDQHRRVVGGARNDISIAFHDYTRRSDLKLLQQTRHAQARRQLLFLRR